MSKDKNTSANKDEETAVSPQQDEGVSSESTAEPTTTAEETTTPVKNNVDGVEEISLPEVGPQSEAQQIEQLKQQVALLMKAAPKMRMALHQKEEKGKKGMSCRISIYEETPGEPGLVVMGWRMIRDKAIKDSKTERDQVSEVSLENGEKIEIPIQEFYTTLIKEEVDLDMERTKFDQNGHLKEVVFERIAHDGQLRRYRMNPVFIN